MMLSLLLDFILVATPFSDLRFTCEINYRNDSCFKWILALEIVLIIISNIYLIYTFIFQGPCKRSSSEKTIQNSCLVCGNIGESDSTVETERNWTAWVSS